MHTLITSDQLTRRQIINVFPKLHLAFSVKTNLQFINDVAVCIYARFKINDCLEYHKRKSRATLRKGKRKNK